MDYFLIDGYNMCFRAYYAMPELTRGDGFPTGALHAFFAGVLKLSSMDTPHSTAIFFDKGGSLRHREIYPQYKANRDAMPENMRMQIEPIMELCSLLGFFVKFQEGIEADDLLASAAEKLFSSGHKISIVSADKDFAQLIRPGVRQLLPPLKSTMGWRELDTVGVRLKFGVSAAQIPDFLALVGDNADNIAGIQGVGPKTAAKWIKDFGSAENIVKRASWLKPEKFQKIVAESADILSRNLQLVRLKTDYELGEISSRAPDFEGVIKFLEKMQMKRAVSSFKKFAKEQYQLDL
ncbi:MAG: 5'-3' exonuclease [Opitutales bacterium]|nr:5'-3' exonuclease [Opitutales bacterium]